MFPYATESEEYAIKVLACPILKVISDSDPTILRKGWNWPDVTV